MNETDSRNSGKYFTYYYWFIIKDTTQAQPDGRDAQGSLGLQPLGSGICVFTSLDALQTPRFRDFYGDAVTQASLIKPLTVGD